MIGYFGQVYFGGTLDDSVPDTGGGTAPPPSGDNRLAADAASVSDWDTVASGVGQDDTAAATESALATGLSVSANRTVQDNATATETAVTLGLGTPPVNPGPPPDTTFASNFRFVDSASSAAQIRLDLDAGYWKVLFEGTSADPPPMEDQRVSGLMTDGEHIAASAYKNRTIKLVLLLTAPNAASAASEIQKLQRELDRETNVLLWQPHVSAPAQWYFTYRGPDVTTGLDWGVSVHRFELAIEAEPFGIGDAVTANITVNVDPAASSVASYFDMSAVQGDVPTPLYITCSNVEIGRGKVAFGVRRRGVPSKVKWFRQAEDAGLTLGTNATRVSGVSDSSGNQVARVAFSTLTSVVRLSGTFPNDGTGAAEWRGTYRVMVRAKATATNIYMQVATGTTAASKGVRTKVDPTSSGQFSVTDLGLVQFPIANAGRRFGYGAEYNTAGGQLYFYADATGGTLDIDWIMLVPADECYGLAFPPAIPAGAQVAFDGVANEVYGLNSAGELATVGSRVPYVDGQLPEVSPTATTNRVFVVPGVDTTLQVANSTQLALRVTYWPRYLVARPVGS